MYFFRSFSILTAFAFHATALALPKPFPAPAALSVEGTLPKRDMTVDQVVVNIQTVTTLSASVNSIVQSASTINLQDPSSLASLTTIATNGAQDIQQIVTNLASYTSAMGGTVFGDADSLTIVGVLNTFVDVHTALLSTLIGQSGIFSQFFLTAPFAVALKALETVIDNFAHGLINMIPSQTTDVQSGQNTLDIKVAQAITLYSQVCIPLFILPPICFTIPS